MWYKITCVWVRPREAANSALSGRARYWVRWNLLFSCCSCKDEYIVLGFRIFFPFPLRRKPPGSSFGSAVKNIHESKLKKTHFKYRYYILNWQEIEICTRYILFHHYSSFLFYPVLPHNRKISTQTYTRTLLWHLVEQKIPIHFSRLFIHPQQQKTSIQPLRFVFFECSIKFNKPERGRANLTLFFLLNNIYIYSYSTSSFQNIKCDDMRSQSVFFIALTRKKLDCVVLY